MAMKLLLLIVTCLLPAIVISQAKDSINIKFEDTTFKIQAQIPNNNSKLPYKAEILTSGFIDIINNGQIMRQQDLFDYILVSPANLPFLFPYIVGCHQTIFIMDKAQCKIETVSSW